MLISNFNLLIKHKMNTFEQTLALIKTSQKVIYEDQEERKTHFIAH